MMISSEITKVLSEIEQICSGKSHLEALEVIEGMSGMRDLLYKLSTGTQSRDKQPSRIPPNPEASKALNMANGIEIAILANDCQKALRVAEQLRMLSKEQHWI